MMYLEEKHSYGKQQNVVINKNRKATQDLK